MAIKVKCPACGAAMSAPDSYHGKPMNCPKCNSRFTALTKEEREEEEREREKQRLHRELEKRKQAQAKEVKREEYLRHLSELDAQKKARLKRHALIGGIAAVVVLVVGIGVSVLMRDTWEKDNREKILALKSEGDNAIETDKILAYRKYISIVEMVGERVLKDQKLRAELAETKEQIEKLREEEDRAEEASKEQRKQLAAEIRRTKESYESYRQYLRKSEAFYDSLFRTSSDLQVGITYHKFLERVQDMNFQYNKWLGSLTHEEKVYPFTSLLKSALNCYITSQKHWRNKIEEGDSRSETLMQDEWAKAISFFTQANKQVREQIEELGNALVDLNIKLREAQEAERLARLRKEQVREVLEKGAAKRVKEERTEKTQGATQLVEQAKKAVVIIRTFHSGTRESMGTGSLITPDGFIITCAHCVQGALVVEVGHLEGADIAWKDATIVSEDEGKDLALLRIEVKDFPFLRIVDHVKNVKQGEEMLLIGHPHALEYSVSKGIVSAIRDGQDGLVLIQHTAEANEGSSGGPLLNNKGEIIGVMSYKLSRSEGLNFAIGADHVKELLRSASAPSRK